MNHRRSSAHELEIKESWQDFFLKQMLFLRDGLIPVEASNVSLSVICMAPDLLQHICLPQFAKHPSPAEGSDTARSAFHFHFFIIEAV